VRRKAEFIEGDITELNKKIEDTSKALDEIEKKLDELYGELRRLNGEGRRQQRTPIQKKQHVEPRSVEVSFADIAIIKDKKEDKSKNNKD